MLHRAIFVAQPATYSVHMEGNVWAQFVDIKYVENLFLKFTMPQSIGIAFGVASLNPLRWEWLWVHRSADVMGVALAS